MGGHGPGPDDQHQGAGNLNGPGNMNGPAGNQHGGWNQAAGGANGAGPNGPHGVWPQPGTDAWERAMERALAGSGGLLFMADDLFAQAVRGPL